MDARTTETITLGSGKLFMMEFSDTMPTKEEICIEANRIGYIKSGAALTYTEETYEERDDLGLVSKIITTKEEAKLKAGLITWNGKSLEKLIDRAKVTEKDGLRTVKIGGRGNAKNKYYVICFWHEDEKDGDVWVIIKGRNTAGLSMTFATEAGTLLEPEFTAMPHDTDGTLIEFIEQMTADGTSDDPAMEDTEF